MDEQQGAQYNIQYPMINHNGKEYEIECKYMYN